MKNTLDLKQTYANKNLLWAVFLFYLIIAGYTMLHHELWGDELIAWNIAKGSTSFFDLIHNLRYEGHPPLWHAILWVISKFSHQLLYMQVVHFAIAAMVVLVVLFYSPFPFITKIILPFGYFFLFEYCVISRNYALGVLFAFVICIILKKDIKYKPIVYYTLLFFLSNVHLITLILAGSLHFYYLLSLVEEKKSRSIILINVLLGAIVLLPAACFIMPPSDGGGLLVHHFFDAEMRQNIKMDASASLRAFVPMPAWWQYHFWNTQFLLDKQVWNNMLRHSLVAIFSLLSIGLPIFVLRKNKKALALFVCNLFVTLLVGMMVHWSAQRYVGFIFIGFLCAWWLHKKERPLQSGLKKVLNGLLFIQAMAGIFAVSRDIRFPFSNYYRVNEVLAKVPANTALVTDAPGQISVAAFTNQPLLFCIDVERTTFVLWGPDFKHFINTPNVYWRGGENYMEQKNIQTFYLFTTRSPKELFTFDPKFFTAFHVQLVDAIEGAIVKNDLYLYKVEK